VGNYNTQQREDLLKQGKALPGKDGGPPRFPIDDGQDVESAVQLARTPEERAHTYKQARRLGKLGKVPAHWKADGTMRGDGA
jgi:hypothetical protein